MKGKGGAKSKAQEEAKPEGEAPTVDKATKARAGKVFGLAVKGATKGERDAARARLQEMAGKVGLEIGAFLRACGLDSEAFFKAEAEDAAQAEAEAVA